MIDAVEQRNHHPFADHLGRGKRKRGFELRRFRRHPENAHRSGELARSRDVNLELPEHDALDSQVSAVAGKRLRPEQEHDLSS